jgi:glycosyltransferase involved in cell wall biosynthesis
VKILFYNHTGEVGGAERLLLLLLERLDRTRFDPLVVCPEGPFRKLVARAGVRNEAVNRLHARFTWRVDYAAGYLKSFLQIIRQLRTRIVEADPDLIHANSVRAGLVATAASLGLGTRVVWHIHDLLPRHPFNPMIRLAALVSRRTTVVAVARASANRFVGGFGSLRKRLTVIANGIDLEQFGQQPGARKRIRAELSVSDEQPVIGIVGRLTAGKGQLELVHAFPKLLEQFPGAVLVIVGAPAFNREHEYAASLDRTIATLGVSDRVRMLGARDDVPAIMQAADIIVVNSASEACSLVILESMAAGTPVMATAVGGTPEIIQHDVNGWLIPPHDQARLISGLAALLADEPLRKRLAAQARQDAAARFDIGRAVTSFGLFYRSLFTSSELPQQKNLSNLKVKLTGD